jgi:LysR family transcriptional regulator, positive regulator for ilvC
MKVIFSPYTVAYNATGDSVELHDLRAFLSASSNLHFGRAGREVNLSPSALSRTIRRLEEEVGERLFVRDTRAVELTPAGRALRRYARELLDGWERFRASLADSRETLRGELSVYCSVAASYTVLAGLIGSFRRRHPGIHLRIETGDPARAVERVQGGLADIAVAARPAALPRSLVFRTIALSPLLFIAPTIACEAAELTARSPIPWARVPMILTAAGLSRRRADAWFRARGIRPNVYAEVSGHEAVVSMVRLGCGVGIVPRLVLDRFAQKGEARVLDSDPALEPYVVGLCAHRRRLSAPLVKAFWDCAP